MVQAQDWKCKFWDYINRNYEKLLLEFSLKVELTRWIY